MPGQPLHPNLARLAAAYDQIIERFSRHEMTPTQARADILALMARDDNGVQWSIDPDSGDWRYRNFKGELVRSEPPAYGLATPTAFDLSRNPNAFNPDSRISFQEVDESLLYAPTSLSGSTRRPSQDTSSALSRLLGTPVRKVVAALALVAVLAGGWALTRDEAPAEPTAPTAPAEPAPAS